MPSNGAFATPQDAVNDPRVLTFGRLLSAANRLEYILGRELEAETGLTHTLFELLLVIRRVGEGGIPVRDIAQARVLTSGGATRLVQRASQLGLITRARPRGDARIQLIELTTAGTSALLAASEIHARNIERHLIEVLPKDQAHLLAETIRVLSVSAARSLPTMP